ncbi:DUF167 domain-containing protein [Candidatus Woesearchaeota archaeon]|nr:DUF167 domain-containing protein [Candidatus Woesearchaeota archaeon]
MNGDFTEVRVRAVPNAKHSSVSAESSGLKVRLTRPAVKGRANKELVELLADYFSVRKADVEIVKGGTSRNKLVRIYGKPPDSR